MSDLERQLRSYAEQLDASAPSLDAIAERATAPAPEPIPPRFPTWLVAAGAAAVAVVAVGSIAVLSTMRTPDDTTASTSTQPTTTVSTTEDSVGTPSLSESPYVELVSDVPIYAGGADGDVGHPKVAAGPVAISDGVYHTLFAAGGEDDTWDAMYHASSPDGSAWDVGSDPVVFPGVEGAAALSIGSLLQLDDGSWITYFHLAFDVGGHGNHIFEYEIRSATAAGPEGPWTVGSEALVLPGVDTWDSHAVTIPNVTRTGDGWVMHYTGYADDVKSGEEPPADVVGASAVGRATSADGVTWVKDPLPVFTGSTDIAWEDGAAAKASVVRDGNLWIMLYAGRTGGSRGLATSTDGVSWQRISEQPVLTALDVPRAAIFTASILVDDGYRLYVSNGGQRTTSSVYELVLSLEPVL